MGGTGVIDNFLGIFTSYIDSGFGLLGGEVAFIATTLIVIDVTLAALFWTWGEGDDILARLIKKTLFVGVFAYIIGNWNSLARIVFESFAGLGLKASGTGFTAAELLQPGRVAQVGLEAGQPILESISDLMGWIAFFENFIQIACLLFAWALVVLAFFILAIQLFVTLIEFKLTTLAGFVLIPFALWNKTSFLAEKVLGNVVSSGIKVLVLAVIVGIGSGLFAEFQVHPDEPSIDHALVVMLASLALLALGIFGPGIATGLVSGAPQLGAGAMAGAAVGAVGTGVAIGAAATGVGGAVMAGARMAPAAAKLAGSGARAATSAASSAKSAFQAGSAAAGGGAKGAAAGLGNVAKTGAQAAGRRAASGASAAGQKVADSFRAGWNGADVGAAGSGQAAAGEGAASAPKQEQPAWAKRMHRRQQITHAATTAAHTLRSGDGGGSGQGPSLRPDA